MVGNYDATTQGHIWNFLVYRYGMSKDEATAAITALQADTVTMLLLPGIIQNWNDIWIVSAAAYRKAKGMSPIVLAITDILGSLLG